MLPAAPGFRCPRTWQTYTFKKSPLKKMIISFANVKLIFIPCDKLLKIGHFNLRLLDFGI